MVPSTPGRRAMVRRARILLDQGVYHVYCRVWCGDNGFQNSEDAESLVGAAKYLIGVDRLTVLAWCLFPFSFPGRQCPFFYCQKTSSRIARMTALTAPDTRSRGCIGRDRSAVHTRWKPSRPHTLLLRRGTNPRSSTPEPDPQLNRPRRSLHRMGLRG